MTDNPATTRPKILVVDDHGVSSQHAVSALGRCAGQVRLEHHAEGALVQALAWHPDVICTDLHLPELDGIELIRRIRASWPVDRRPPRIVLLTGDRNALTRNDLSSLNIDHILIKPVSGGQLRKAIQTTTVDEAGMAYQSRAGTELLQLFLEELEHRLPELDRCISLADHRKAAHILHQLIASAAMTGERKLESSLRALAAQCNEGDSTSGLANCYYTLLESSHEFQLRQRVPLP